MFMIVSLGGDITTRQIMAPVNANTLRNRPWRSREQWMEKMNVVARSIGAEFYAFRYRGQWHLCNCFDHHQPMLLLDGDSREAAEMWVRARQEAAH